MAAPVTHLIVTQRAAVGGRWGRRRAGLEFGRAPRAVYPADLGEGLKAAINLAQLLDDPMLDVAMAGEDGEPRAVSRDDRAGLQALIDAEGHRVDPGAPPTPEAGLKAAPEEAAAQTNDHGAGGEPAAPAQEAQTAKAARASGRKPRK